MNAHFVQPDTEVAGIAEPSQANRIETGKNASFALYVSQSGQPV
jgi:hypothetical protein